jgi:hypothetical protein
MEIQRGKEGMKSQDFNQLLGAMTGCTLRLLLGCVPQGMPVIKYGVRGDAWFGSVRTANEVALRGHEGVFQIKQYHSLFSKEYIGYVLKDAPGSVHILLKGTTKVEVSLVALGYQYSRKTVLHFILTKNGGSSKPGVPYIIKYTDSFGNICICNVDCPQNVSIFLHLQILSTCITGCTKTR